VIRAFLKDLYNYEVDLLQIWQTYSIHNIIPEFLKIWNSGIPKKAIFSSIYITKLLMVVKKKILPKYIKIRI